METRRIARTLLRLLLLVIWVSSVVVETGGQVLGVSES